MEHAVVSAAQGTVHTLLGKLGTILVQEAQLLGSLRSQLQYLKDELESMTAFLQDLAERDEHRKQAKIWMKQVREIAYDVEDCIDEFKHHLGDSNGGEGGGVPVALWRRTIHKLLTIRVRHRIVKQIQELKMRTKDISDRNSRYNSNNLIVGAAGSSTVAYDTPTNRLDLDARLTALFPERRQLVGIELRQDNLMQWLMEENMQQLRVISIFGFGGLGKTTLAMTVYQSLSAKGGRFQCQAFVTVSQRFDVKVLMKDILLQIIQPVHQKDCNTPSRAGETPLEDLLKGMEAWDVGQLASTLRQQLETKRYLIVLDDIWSIAAWESIRFSLPDSNNGSRILITTRIRIVAHTCCFHEHDRAYEIEPLTNYESRHLFFKRIFGSTVNCPGNLKEISENILGKCGGTPLAIVSIAGLLASKPVHSIDQWQTIYNSLGSELETSPSLERLKKILELSYNDLPYHLKTCFLYLSIYPEDHIIKKKSVLRRWIAERFMTEKRGLSAFEVAESYFEEFINRSIIQPVEMSFTGKVKTFRVHDMMLEIIVSKSVEENFITLVGEHTLVPQEKIRRLSVHGGIVKNIATSRMLSHVRSLSIFADGEILQFGWMKLMRVLDLEGNEFLRNKDLKNVCMLFQLEYLGLRRTHVMELPKQIRNLQKLVTLDIRETGIKILPTGITNLPLLANLLGGRGFYNHNGVWPVSEYWGLHVPNKLGNLKALKTLAQVEIIDCNSSSIIKLGKLSQLRKLGVMMFVDDDNTWASLISVLECLSNSLCSLLLWRPYGKMNFDTLDSLTRPPIFMKSINFRGQLRKLPKWFPLLSNLTELTLRATELSIKEDLKVLARLPSLLYLRLHHSAYVEAEFTIAASEFPCLKLLVIHLAMFEAWKARFHKGALPRLEKLELSLFEEASIQDVSGIEFLPSLKDVSISACPGNAMEETIQALTVDAQKNLNKPTVTFNSKKWVPMKSRSDPPLDHRGNLRSSHLDDL